MKRTIILLSIAAVVLVMGSCTRSSPPEFKKVVKEVVSPAPSSSSDDSGTSTTAYSYNLTIEVNPSEGGYVVPGNRVYKPGEEVTLTAIAASGYEFSSWSGNVSGSITEIKIILNSDMTVIANFDDIKDPRISDVAISWVNDATATITWKTDEETSSLVRYGKTTDYPFSSPQDDIFADNHSVTLTDLIPQVTYHFRAVSIDRSGNESVSKDFTFTTRTTEECVISHIDSASVFGKSVYKLNYSINNSSSQVISLDRVVVFDEQGKEKYIVSESFINEMAPEGKLMPGKTYYWSESLDSPYLVVDINLWEIRWYCLDTRGNEFIVTGRLP